MGYQTISAFDKGVPLNGQENKSRLEEGSTISSKIVVRRSCGVIVYLISWTTT